MYTSYFAKLNLLVVHFYLLPKPPKFYKGLEYKKLGTKVINYLWTTNGK